MTIVVAAKFAKPPKLLGGDPSATMLNLMVGIMIFVLYSQMLALIVSGIGQVAIFYKTYKNLFFFEEIFIKFNSVNNLAKNKRGVERYV